MDLTLVAFPVVILLLFLIGAYYATKRWDSKPIVRFVMVVLPATLIAAVFT